jgi:glycosyltransferase involved in cell wall biosynthesis
MQGQEEVRSLTILTVSYPFAPVAARVAGGAEQIVAALDNALVTHGWQSVVVAHAGSHVTGHLVGVSVPDSLITPGLRSEVESRVQSSIDRVLACFPVDLVHLHGFDFHRYHFPPHLPVLVTLHLPPSWYPESIWSLPENYTLQCVSQTQRDMCPQRARHGVVVIENGVQIPPALAAKKDPFALMLSRICPEKNLHAGLHAARMAKLPVLLAGDVFPYDEHLRYFHEVICPLLGRGRARLLHAVGGEQKKKLLSRATCLLLPTLAPETSSLVAMEAAAAGTPVCAFPSGEIARIVEDGRTGFLVNSAEEMASAISQLNQIDPEVCRAVAASRFSLHRMIEGYLSLYRQMAAARLVPG